MRVLERDDEKINWNDVILNSKKILIALEIKNFNYGIKFFLLLN
jgi:hypothetical protein